MWLGSAGLDFTSILQDLGLFLGFFSLDIFSAELYVLWSIIPWNFIGSLYTILGKSPMESKTQDFISSDIFSKDLRKFGLFLKFLFPGFSYQKLFFLGLSNKDSICSTLSGRIDRLNFLLFFVEKIRVDMTVSPETT